MTKMHWKLIIAGSFLIILFIFNSFSLFPLPEINNNISKDEFIGSLEGLEFSATYWTTTKVVSTESTSFSDSPMIAVDDVGNAHVAWHDRTDYNGSGTDDDIFYKRWNATSITWTVTEVVSTESTASSVGATIALDDTGNVHVAWEDATNYSGSGTDADIFYKQWNAANNTWTATEVVSTESSEQSGPPQITVDDAENVHVVWWDRMNYSDSGTDVDIFYKRRNAVNSTWTASEVVSTESTDDSSEPTIAVDSTGNVHVAWHDGTDYNGSGSVSDLWDWDIFYKRWEVNSSTWTTTEVISTMGSGFFSDSYYPTIAVDNAGNVHIAWEDEYSGVVGAGPGMDIFYKRLNATSSTWTQTEVVSTENGGVNPTIAMVGAGSVHVAYQHSINYNGSGTDSDIFYKRRNAVNNTWTTAEVVSTESTEDSLWSKIALDGVGRVHVAWHDETNYNSSGSDGDIFYKQLYLDPEIIIFTPNQYDPFSIVAPNFNIYLTVSNLDTMWYTLDDGIINITFSQFTGAINQTEWDKKGNGAVTIRFYVSDSFGREGYAEVVILKDLNPPTSLLSFIPYRGINEVNISTTFILTADDGLGSGLSVIRYKINNSAWVVYTGPFNLSSYTHGDYLISYHAIDLANNIETENTLLVRLVKLPIEMLVPGYNIFLLIGLICVVSVILTKKRNKNK